MTSEEQQETKRMNYPGIKFNNSTSINTKFEASNQRCSTVDRHNFNLAKVRILHQKTKKLRFKHLHRIQSVNSQFQLQNEIHPLRTNILQVEGVVACTLAELKGNSSAISYVITLVYAKVMNKQY